jgi:hypothetical protein
MTQKGRNDVLDAIKALYPTGSTNLWDGLKVGMDMLTSIKPTSDSKPGSSLSGRLASIGLSKKEGTSSDAPSSSARLSTLFILTDGMPNVIPPRGHIPMLKAYLDTHDNCKPFNISTFGFGYFLETPLLLEIAQVGGGGYGFIPDSGMVGTVFVHAVSNVYATYAPRIKVDVEVPEGCHFVVKGSLPSTETSWGGQIQAGDLQFGQSLDLVLSFNEIPKDITATVTYRPYTSKEDRKVYASLSGAPPGEMARIRYHAARCRLVDIINEPDETLPSNQKKEELKKLADSVPSELPEAAALAKDISGEVMLALESTAHNRWGCHYLPSLARSHLRQQCSNFKDPGLQVYGKDSAIFLEERNKLDAAFMSLPPPEPSLTVTHAFGRGGVSNTAGSPKKIAMSMYYSSSGPCFAGDCSVQLSTGESVKVEELKRGMKVRTLSGTNEVAVVVRTHIQGGVTELCRVGELKVTPWHPIVASGSKDMWVFPADVAPAESTPCEAVYSVLLLPSADDVDAHSISVGGVWCVTLGHGLTKGSEDVRSHAFLGDYEKVLKDLSSLEEFYDEKGMVRCVGTRRDPLDGTICGFVGQTGEVSIRLVEMSSGKALKV